MNGNRIETDSGGFFTEHIRKERKRYRGILFRNNSRLKKTYRKGSICRRGAVAQLNCAKKRRVRIITDKEFYCMSCDKEITEEQADKTRNKLGFIYCESCEESGEN